MGTQHSIVQPPSPPHYDHKQQLRITVVQSNFGGDIPDHLINKFVDDRYEQIWTGNLGVSFSVKHTCIDDVTVRLLLFYERVFWSTSSVNRFMRGNGGLMLLYNVHNEKSFECVKRIIEQNEEVSW